MSGLCVSLERHVSNRFGGWAATLIMFGSLCNPVIYCWRRVKPGSLQWDPGPMNVTIKTGPEYDIAYMYTIVSLATVFSVVERLRMRRIVPKIILAPSNKASISISISNLYFNTVKKIHQVFCYIIMKDKLVHNNI